MFRSLVLILLIFISFTTSWPFKRLKFKPNAENTCCTSAKLNINATRANSGREFFANLISNNDSYKDVNEENICSLMHFFMQEAVMNGRPIKFSKGFFSVFNWKKKCKLNFFGIL